MRTSKNHLNTIIKNSFLNFKKDKTNFPKKQNFMMPLDQFKKMFQLEATNYYASIKREFIIDNDNKNFLKIFCKYFANDITFETEHSGDLSKSLFVYGTPGTGKTSSFKIIQNISKKYNLMPLWIPLIPTIDVVGKYNKSDSKYKEFIVQEYSKGKMLFDDLASEKEGNNFGREDLFVRIIELRYNQYIEKGTKTFITSNLNLEQIKKRYGIRLYDRIFEMCNLLELTGKSKR